MDNHAGYYGCPVCEHKGTLICGKTALTEPVEQEPVEEKEVEQEEDVIEIEMGNIEELQVEESQTQNQARNEGGKGKKRTPKKTMYFPPSKPPAPLRTLEKTVQYAGNALANKKKEMGVHGPSVLALITDYDHIEAFSVDYMHGNCLGVGKSELILWTDSKYSNQSWYIRDLLEVIDGDLLRTRPPTVINRTPRSIEEHLSYWKASELRAWILFYLVPILHNRLSEPYYSHWCCFVLGLHILLLGSIPPFLLDLAHSLFVFFYEQQEKIYGSHFCFLNVHNLIHYVKCVIRFGPLWAHNCFIFESEYGDLSKQVLGTHQIIQSVLYRYFMKRSLKLIKFNPSEEVAAYLEKSGLYKPRNSSLETSLLGNPTNHVLTTKELKALKKLGINDLRIYIWKRLNFKGLIYTSQIYEAMEKKSNSSISFSHQKKICYGDIRFFFQKGAKIFAMVTMFKKTKEKSPFKLLDKLDDYLIPIFPECVQDELTAIEVNDIHNLVVKITPGNCRHFVAKIPNKSG